MRLQLLELKKEKLEHQTFSHFLPAELPVHLIFASFLQEGIHKRTTNRNRVTDHYLPSLQIPSFSIDKIPSCVSSNKRSPTLNRTNWTKRTATMSAPHHRHHNMELLAGSEGILFCWIYLIVPATWAHAENNRPDIRTSNFFLQTLSLSSNSWLQPWQRQHKAPAVTMLHSSNGNMMVLCALPCFVLSFTDSFRDKEGNARYRFVAFKGLWGHRQSSTSWSTRCSWMNTISRLCPLNCFSNDFCFYTAVRPKCGVFLQSNTVRVSKESSHNIADYYSGYWQNAVCQLPSHPPWHWLSTLHNSLVIKDLARSNSCWLIKQV